MRLSRQLFTVALSTAIVGCQLGLSIALAEEEAVKAPLQGNVSKEHKAKKLSGADKLAGVVHKSLESGAMLLARPDDVILDTPYGTIKVDGDSVVMVVVSPKSICIFDLHDPHKNAVVINSKSGPLALHPAYACVIADKALKSFDDVNPAPCVPYRALVTKALDADYQVFQADFDVMSMVRGFPAIGKMIDSPDPKVKDLMSDMLKTTAINMSTRQSNDPYQYYMTAEVRALMAKTLAAKEQQSKSN